LDARQCLTMPISIYAPYSAGDVFIGAIADPYDYENELVEDNNVSATLAVQYVDGPDLAVTAVQAPPVLGEWDNARFTVTVCNRGSQSSWSGQVKAYLSLDQEVTMADYEVGNQPLGELLPGQCTMIPVDIMSQSGYQGEYYAGAIVESFSAPDVNSANDGMTGDSIIVGNGVDIAIVEISAPSRVPLWTEFEIMVTLCNQGNSMSMGGNLTIVVSSDPVIDMMDPMHSYITWSQLNPGHCLTAPARIDWLSSEGTYYLGARMDSSPGSDLDSGNNQKASDPVVAVNQ